MRQRGTAWVNLAEQIAAPTKSVDPAPRPSPRPPVEARPTQLSVTQIKTLIRDPYAIYARKVLGLHALDPLSQTADAPLRGIIVHSVLERFVREKIDPSSPDAADRLMEMATDALGEHCPWPAVRTLWHARIAAFVPHFLKEEQQRQTMGTNAGLEVRGRLTLPNIAFTLTGTADRIDLTEGEEALIYDYKTGKAPSKPQQLHFDKQLLLEAAMVEHGAFDGINAIRTKSAVYIGLGADLKNQEAPLKDSPTDETLRRFEGLIAKWMDLAKGYTSRSANETLTFEGPYDHLARYGEWDETSEPMAEDLS
jgi:RecB family exonuclease